MRYLTFSLALMAVAGCGSSALPPQPAVLVGNYSVMIAANGQTDMDVMNVTVGSGTDVLLDFAEGISTPTGLGVRCSVIGSTGLDIVRQTMTVGHATGAVEGIGDGMGTITAMGAVNITLTVETPGVGPPDAGSGGAPVAYVITGTRNN